MQCTRIIKLKYKHTDVKSNAHQEVLLSTNLTYNKGELHGLKISASLIMLSNQGVESK